MRTITHELFEREKRYRLAIAVAKSMLRKGIIDEDDYRDIDTKLLTYFRPVLAGLYPQSACRLSENYER